MSVSDISGLVGVSMCISFVFGLIAASTASRFARIDVLDLDAVVRNDLVEQPRRAAIDIVRADQVIARMQRGHQRIDRRHAARKRMPARAAFERGQRFFQAVTRGVAGARVIPAPVGANAGEFKGG